MSSQYPRPIHLWLYLHTQAHIDTHVHMEWAMDPTRGLCAVGPLQLDWVRDALAPLPHLGARLGCLSRLARDAQPPPSPHGELGSETVIHLDCWLKYL